MRVNTTLVDAAVAVGAKEIVTVRPDMLVIVAPIGIFALVTPIPTASIVAGDETVKVKLPEVKATAVFVSVLLDGRFVVDKLNPTKFLITDTARA